MPSPTDITPSQLARRIGLPDAPVIIDTRIDDDFAADPRQIPTAIRRGHRDAAVWAPAYAGRSVVVTCQRGAKLSQGTAALLRHYGAAAESLEGGFEAWRDASLPLLAPAHIPPRNAQGHTLWVTRQRPKIDRVACPWLIRRFIDPGAIFMFVPPSDVVDVADRFAATAFDIEDSFWSHRGPLCTFDVMLDEFALHTPALDRLALIIRAADTATLDAAPEAAGLLAASLGLSRMYRDDLAQLDAALPLYDAFYRWCRDATDETHNWPAANRKSQ